MVTALCLGMAAPVVAQQTVVAAPHGGVRDADADALLARRVTLRVKHAPLRDAINTVAAQANVSIGYALELVDVQKRFVTLNATQQPLGAVLTELLTGTNLRVVVTGADAIALQSSETEVAAQGDGRVTGVVTDAAAKRPIADAAVTVDSGKSVKTRENGSFTIPAVSAGLHRVTVRAIGYRVYTTPVTVRTGATETLAIMLTPSATTLTDVVTTATGERRRYEVGNSIATINADSVVKTALIRNVSDLLQARVPGVIVQNANGMVGAPSKIRIRGINSLVLNNDPIVILDGVRLNAQATDGFNQTNTGSTSMLPTLTGSGRQAAAPARLDDIDPNTIESIDVLRGPSASSLYGTDAANGVIVIKTKRGHAGAWRATVAGSSGWSFIPGQFGDMWWGFGRVGGFSTAQCTLTVGGQGNVSGGSCAQDSVRNFNYENNDDMRTMGTGTARGMNATLSGGSEALQQFFSLSTTSDVGMAKMSNAQTRLIERLWSSPAPSWMVHPNTQQEINGMSTTTFNVTPQANVAVTANGIYRNVLNGGSGISIPSGIGGGVSPGDTLSFLPSDQQRTRVASIAKRGVLTTNGSYAPRSWLSFAATIGGDYTVNTGASDLRAQDCTPAVQFVNSGTAACPSGHLALREETFIKTVNGSMHLSFSPWSWVRAQTSLGENYNHTDYYGLQVGNNFGQNCNLAFGTTLLTPTPVCLYPGSQMYQVNENRDESAKAGWYLEQSLTLFGVYATTGFRKDVASAFGSQTNKTPPSYPKIDVSYPISEQSFFPKQSLVSSLRLRVSYGQSGNAASQTGVLNQYTLQQEVIGDASSSTNVVYVQQLGNANLKPERGTEWEGGFDASFLENERLQVGMNLYRKYTRDAINYLTVPGSYGMETSSMFVNLGNVENRGVEWWGTIRLIDSRALGWDFNLKFSSNNNKLVHKSPSLPTLGFGNSRNVEGYPIYGYWATPVASYADKNGDGILQQNEIIFGTPKYAGSADPRGEVTYTNNIRLLNGALTFNATIHQVNGLTSLWGFGGLPRGAVDPTSSLAEQAGWLQANVNNGNYIGEVSSVRLNELSVTYNVPLKFAQRLLHVRSLGISAAGRNLGLWTNYIGKDPNISAGSGNGEMWYDDGTGVPQPRDVSLRFNLGL